MNIIDKVYIKGFWGDKEINVEFFADVNFFIGVNGSGKTTAINLIAAALSADFETLDKVDFSSIEIKLSEVSGNKKPIIKVEKKPIEGSPYSNITYEIKEKTSDLNPTLFSLNDFEEESMIRFPRSRYYHTQRRRSRGVASQLKKLINVSWLSIHRASQDGFDDENYTSSVDQKLDELGGELSKYFYSMSSKVSHEISVFQRNLIASLLTEQTQTSLINLTKNLNLGQEKQSLEDVFEKLGISNKKLLDSYFDSIKTTFEKLDKGVDKLDVDDLLILFRSARNSKVVQDWNELREKQTDIMKPKHLFLEILNSLFQRKTIGVNEKSELEITTQSNKKFSVSKLSSGEKQLIIILGEALLQNSAPWVYITDEPELSLHVNWQEGLVSNLLKLNPNSQILCATHSPDMVGRYSANVFNMESTIK